MKYQPELAVLFGRFSREISRFEAAEILRATRRTRANCHRLLPGWWALGAFDLHTRKI